MATTKKTTKKKAVAKVRKTETALTKSEARELTVFSMDGKKVSTITLPEKIFGAKWRPDLVHQVTTALAANKRQNRANTKDRSEVAGGGKKPWKQKGTGQARHGSSRSPIWRHGGITFGPRVERDYHEKISKSMRAEALFSVLARKAKDGEIILVDKFSFEKPKTKEAISSLIALAKVSEAKILSKKGNAALIAFAGHEANAVKSFRNLENVSTEDVRNLNPLNVLSYRYLVIENPESAFETLAKRV